MVIFITKSRQILKILYPNKIDAEQFEDVVDIVMPMIHTLVRHASTPMIPLPPTEQLKTSIAIKPVTLSDNIEQCDDKNDVVTCSNPIFVEDEKHQIDETWESTLYGDTPFLRNGDKRVIRSDSCRIDTTWDYLCSFFDSLHDSVAVSTIDGLNKKKVRALVRFFEEHPNFNCHIENKSGFNVLFKDEVHVHVKTTHDDAGTVDSEHYGE